MNDFTQKLAQSLLVFSGRVINPTDSCWSDVNDLIIEARRRNDYHDDDVRKTVVYGTDLLSAYPSIRSKRLDVGSVIPRCKTTHRQYDPLTSKVYEVTLMLYQDGDDEAYVVNTFDNMDADTPSKKQYYVTADLIDAMRQYDDFIEEFVQNNS